MRFRLAAHYPYLIAGGLLVAAIGVAQAPARAADAGFAAKIANFVIAPNIDVFVQAPSSNGFRLPRQEDQWPGCTVYPLKCQKCCDKS